MSRRSRQNSDHKRPDKQSSGRGFLIVAIGVGVMAIVLAALQSNRGAGNSASSAKDPATTNVVVSAGEAKPAYSRLLGKWVRPDGGYVIDIKSADETGKLDAGYFNPDPIHVARAEASGQDSMIKVFIELRDVNYPGSTYTLGYDPATDQLKGIYYQAMEKQQYQVFFSRPR